MPVRNIRSLGNSKPIPIYVWIPPIYNPVYKIEVVTSSNTYDITSIMIEGEYTDGITETIGSFEFKIDNSSEIYTDLFSPYDKVNIYMDYGATATTKVFTGKIERISKTNNSLVLTGRSSAIRTIGKNVTYSVTNTKRSDVLKAIINKYFDYITTNNLEDDDTLIDVDYEEKPFWEVVEELCLAAGYDAYIDQDFDFHYFQSGSRQNTTEAVVHNANIVDVGDFSPDLQLVYNKVRVYGKSINDLPIFATAEDSSSQSQYDVKELTIHDTSINTVEQAQARADYELSVNKDPPIIGSVLSLGLPTIKPGEQIRISDPQNGLEPKYYTIQKFTHKFSNDDPFMTELTIQKERTTVSQILKKRIKFEFSSSEKNNPNELDHSYLITFDSDSGTHTNTEIDTNIGVLKVASGSSSGVWISDNYEVDENITVAEVRLSGNNLGGSSVYISLTGGEPYTPITLKQANAQSGNNIRIKVALANANAELKTIAVYYKY